MVFNKSGRGVKDIQTITGDVMIVKIISKLSGIIRKPSAPIKENRIKSKCEREREKAAIYGIELPEYPGDGNQDCGDKCKCRWEIVEKKTEIHAHWLMDIRANHCESCRQNTAKWNPYIIKKDK